jgi:ankyrin repeat protein
MESRIANPNITIVVCLFFVLLMTSCASRTPLMRKAKRCNKEKVLALIEKGVDVNAKDKYGWTALIEASFCQDSELIRVLIDAGADVNATSFYSFETALHFATNSEYANRDIVKLLLNAGADVNASNNRRRTPLHNAVRAGRPDIALLLLENGADINVRDHHGNTALKFAAGLFYNMEMVRLLINAGADIKDLEKVRLNEHNHELYELLIELGMVEKRD